MRKIVLAASLISCIALHALEQTDLPRDIKLSPLEWQDLRASTHCLEDQVIFRDADKACGEMVSIPSLSYQFGDISFKIKDLSLIIFAPDNNKVQYVTHDGSSFVGSVPKEGAGDFKFSLEMDGLYVSQALDPSRTKYIILREREARLSPVNKLYTIELQNGDHMAVQLDSAPIRLSDGKQEFQLSPDEVIDLCFNGGLYGDTSKGKLGFSFLKDKYLEVHVGWGNQTLRLPWEQISHVRRQENISLLEPQKDDGTRVAKGSFIIIKQPDSIFVDSETFEKWSQIDFEASILFDEGVPFDDYAVAFDADKLFEEEVMGEDYAEVAFEPMKMFETPDFFDEWQIAFEAEQPVLTPEQTSDLHFEMLAAEPLAPSSGIDIDEQAFAEKAELIADKTKPIDYIDEDEFKIVEEMDSLDDSVESLVVEDDSLEDALYFEEPDIRNEVLSIEQEDPINDLKSFDEPDTIDDALSLEEGDSMIYVPHQIHTLGEYTQKTHSLVRDRTLDATVLPTDQYPTLIVRMPGFFIDKKLVSNAEYAQFIKDTKRRAPDHWNGGRYDEGKGNEPVVNVTYHDAKAYAAWVGKRVPTESEWIRAANRGVFNLESKNLLKEWTSSVAYPSEGSNGDLVVIAPMMFKKQEIVLIPHSAPREVITIVNENVCNAQTGFRCMSEAQE